MSEQTNKNSFFQKCAKLLFPDISISPFTFTISIGLAAGYQLTKGRSFRQFFSMWYFRRTKKYCKALKFIIDRDESSLKKYFESEENNGYAFFIDGPSGIGKTSYLQLLADKCSKSSPVLYLTIREAKVNKSKSFSVIAHSIKYIPTLNMKTFNRDYDDALEHLNKLLKIHSFLRLFCLTKYLCPFLKPKIPIIIIDDVQSLFSKGQLIESDTRLILERYSIRWLDENLAKIIFITSEGGVFSSMRKLSGWSSRLRLKSFEPIDKNVFNDLIIKFPDFFKKSKKDHAEYFEFFGGDLRILKRFEDYEGEFESFKNEIISESKFSLTEIISKSNKVETTIVLDAILNNNNKLMIQDVIEKYYHLQYIFEVLTEDNIIRKSMKQNNIFYEFHSKKMERTYEKIRSEKMEKMNNQNRTKTEENMT